MNAPLVKNPRLGSQSLLLILALGWGTHHPLGIAGAGISSLLSETIACICAVVYTWRRPIYQIFSSLDLNMRLALDCARLGLPEVASFGLESWPLSGGILPWALPSGL